MRFAYPPYEKLQFIKRSEIASLRSQ